MEKKYDHKSYELACRKKWQEERIYTHERHSGPDFSIDTPPPTVSGALHIGHIFSYTQTDIIARYKRMSGFCVYYPFGFDDNGLATERFVEKQKGVRAHEMKRSEFIKLCLEVTQQVEQEFKELWQRVGLSIDWNYCYSTIDEQSRRISQRSFIDLFNKGYIYRKDEPAPFCIMCRTSVAQAELDDKEQPSFFNTIAFQAEQGADLLIATTRPELLPSCVALFFHPKDSRYQHLKNTHATVPLFGNKIPILADEMVDPEKGTGLVMCCTFGDKTDIFWFKKHNLPYRPSIDRDGKFKKEISIIGGLGLSQARQKILEELKKDTSLKEQKPIMHSVNVHERCQKEIEFLSLPQWFLTLLPYKNTFIEKAHQIHWHPEYMKSRYQNWVENISWDWCLSRQRFYGIPFPVWFCQKCGQVLLARADQLPIDPQETPYEGPCSACGSEDIIPETDIMDTWNTSSLTPYIAMALKKGTSNEILSTDCLPMNMRAQAHDIIRTWAFYTIVKAWMHEDTIPWKDIVISGHVLAGKKKLSKSKENDHLKPENLLTLYSADAIRYWTASGTLGTDIIFSENQLRIGERLVVKLWNAYKFIWQNLDQDESKYQKISINDIKLDTVNAWILHQASLTFDQYQKYFQSYEFSLALQTIERFFWRDFCDTYLELIKDILFHKEKYDLLEVETTLMILYHIGLRILQLYSPYVPYITEVLYEIIYKKYEETESIHLTKFSQYQIRYQFPNQAVIMDQLLEIIGTIRKLKTEKKLSLRTELATLTIHASNKKSFELILEHEKLIKGVTKTQEIIYEQADTASDILSEHEGTWHAHVVVR